jgi:hypothetical protein
MVLILMLRLRFLRRQKYEKIGYQGEEILFSIETVSKARPFWKGWTV